MTSDGAAFLDEIDELLETDKFNWARATLIGIQETVKRTKNVTELQRRAVDNITAGQRSGLPSERYRSSRRYEGWTPSR